MLDPKLVERNYSEAGAQDTSNHGLFAICAGDRVTGGTVQAAGAWETVGTAGFSDNDVNYPRIIFTSNGTPYVAYTEDTGGGLEYHMSAKRFDGSAWVQVGSQHFSAGDAEIVEARMSPTNVPYIAYGDQTQGYKLTVERFNGTDWELVGAAGFTAGEADGHDLAFAPDGTPYIVFANSSDNRRLTVMKFNGTVWVDVGAASFTPDSSAGVALAITSTGVPYVVYSDHSVSNKLSSMRFNGTAWVQVGTAGFTPGSALPDADGFEMGAGDEPYVAFMDVANGVKISVMKFNGSAWEYVGTPGFSAGQASSTRLAMTSTGRPYVVYQDVANGNKATVQRFNGTDWELVGAAGFTPDFAANATIGFDARDIPYVAYADGSQGFNLTVQRFVGGPDQLTDPTSVTMPNAENGKSISIQAPFGTKISCHSAATESNVATADAGYSYPVGLVRYCFTTDSSSNQVTLVFVTGLKPNEVTIRKYDSLTHTYLRVPGATIAETTLGGQPALLVSYPIVDNGSLDENAAVGAITDPVGLAVPAGAPDTGYPKDSSWRAAALLIIGASALTLLGLRRKRDARVTLA